MMAAREKPMVTRWKERIALRTSACSKWSLGKAFSTSIGCGRMSGASIRSSTRSPRVTNHHAPSTSAMKPNMSSSSLEWASGWRTRSPTRRTNTVSSAAKMRAKRRKPVMVSCSSERRSRRSSSSQTRYSFSSGNTFTSTRRFFLLCSGLLGSVRPAAGLSQPLPITLNLFGSNLHFARIAFRTASARS